MTGLVNASRFVLLLGSESSKDAPTRLRLAHGKSNYARPFDHVDLMFDASGAVVPLDEAARILGAEEAKKKQANADAKKTERRESIVSADAIKIGGAIVSVLTKSPGLGRGDLDSAVAVEAKKRKPLCADVITAWKVEGKITTGPKVGRKEPHYLAPTQSAACPTVTSEASPPPTNGISTGALDAMFAGAS